MPRLNVSDILYDDKFNARGKIRPDEVEQLKRLIASAGLIQPVTVRSAEDARITSHKWHLIAGHRRYLAVTGLGLKTIEANIRENCDDATAHKINLTENLGRKDFHPGQELDAIVSVYGEQPDVDRVAADLGVGKEWVRRRLKIQRLPATIKPYFFDGSLNAFDLSVLIGCPLDEQETLVRELLAAKSLGKSSSSTMKKAGKLSRPKSKNEIYDMITLLMEMGIEPPGWRCLAWAAGNLEDSDLTNLDS